MNALEQLRAAMARFQVSEQELLEVCRQEGDYAHSLEELPAEAVDRWIGRFDIYERRLALEEA